MRRGNRAAYFYTKCVVSAAHFFILEDKALNDNIEIRSLEKTESSINKTIKYLKTVMELETSAYELYEAIKEAKEDLNRTITYGIEPIKTNTIRKPEKKLPTTPIRKNAPNKHAIGKYSVMFMVFYAVTLLAVYLMNTSMNTWMDNGVIIWWLCTLPLFIRVFVSLLGSIEKKQTQKKYDQEYEFEMYRYREKCNKINEEYEIKLKEYENAERKAEEDYQYKIKTREENITTAKAEIDRMRSVLIDTENALEQAYSYNIIYPKYRNMVAICSFYDYFASGRCDMYEGKDGAYNLYESELRQNTIISKLDSIAENLEAIKGSQYALYNKMMEASDTVFDISNSIKQISIGVGKNIELQRLSAKSAEISSKNIEALKYISLIGIAQN